MPPSLNPTNTHPKSFQGFFQNIPAAEQKSRDDDYNLKSKYPSNNNLLYYPSVQLLRNWNCNSLAIKSELKITVLKSTIKTSKISNYEEDCLKVNCYICKQAWNSSNTSSYFVAGPILCCNNSQKHYNFLFSPTAAPVFSHVQDFNTIMTTINQGSGMKTGMPMPDLRHIMCNNNMWTINVS